MINLKKIDNIAAFGCSWTAGDEIIDHELLNLSYEKCRRLKIRLGPDKFGSQLTKDGIRYTDVLNSNESEFLMGQRTWAAHLAKGLGIENFRNYAKGGSSMDYILYRIIKNIREGNITKSTLIVVGLTFPNRIMMYPTKENCPKNYILGSSNEQIPSSILKWAVNHIWTDNNLIYNWLRTISLIPDLHKNIIIQPLRPLSVIKDINQYYTLDDTIKHYANLVDKKLEKKTLLKTDTLVLEPDSHTGFGHCPESSHIELANKLIKKIKENQ